MRDRARLRLAVIGAGSMGSLHARAIAASDDADLAAVVDVREEAGRSLAERYGSRWLPEIDVNEGLDGVVLAAATEAHAALAERLLAAGVPTLIEKPVSDDLARTTRLLELARDRRVPVMCGLLERFNPAVLTARQLVEAPIHIVATRHSPYAPRIKTGVAWDLLIHDVDLAISLVGRPIESVTGALGYFHPSSLPQAEDVAEATLGFDGGAIAQISASRIGQRKARFLTIHELDRLVEVDLLRRDVTLYRHVSGQAADDEGRGYRQQTIIEIPEPVANAEPLVAQLSHFIALLRGEVDADLERESILPSHRVVEALMGSGR